MACIFYNMPCVFFEKTANNIKKAKLLCVKSYKTFQNGGMLVKMNKAYYGSPEIVQKSLYLQIK